MTSAEIENTVLGNVPVASCAASETTLQQTKAELLNRCVTHCVNEGFSNLTLRSLANGVGTSHRMLIYYFESREKLLKAILENFRHRQIASVVEDLEHVNTLEDLEKIIRHIWTRLSSKELRSFTTAFFEFYVKCIRTKEAPDSSQFLTAALDDWLKPVVAAFQRLRVPDQECHTIARLLLGALRGLLLDILASSDEVALAKTIDLLIQAIRLSVQH
ncbi:MAG: TetR family transcriptional regulator [Bdellovibrionia bacterium]